MDSNSLGLVAVGRFDHDLRHPGPRPVIAYNVTGLPATHACQIVFAGTNASGVRTWAIQWQITRDKVKVPSVFYDSPEEGLEVIKQMLPQIE